MTLVALHNFDDARRPLFISDLLESSSKKSAVKIEIPTVGDVSQIQVPSADYNISGFRQKISVIEKNIAVAISGQIIAGRNLCNCIAEIYKKERVADVEHFLEIIKGHLSDTEVIRDLQKVSAIINYVSVKDGMKNGVSILVNHKGGFAGKSPIFGQVISIGTGAKTYGKMACDLKLMQGTTKALDPIYSDLFCSFMPLGTFLAEEVISGAGNLSEYWGSGFEITLFSGGGINSFIKLGGILYVIGEFRENEVSPKKLIKTEYQHENLIMRATKLEDRGPNTYRIIEDNLFVVPPLRLVDRPKRVTIPEFERNTLLCFVALGKNKSGYPATCMIIVPTYEIMSPNLKRANSAPLPYSILQNKDSLTFTLSSRFLQRLGQMVAAHTQSDSKLRDNIAAGLWQ